MAWLVCVCGFESLCFSGSSALPFHFRLLLLLLWKPLILIAFLISLIIHRRHQLIRIPTALPQAIFLTLPTYHKLTALRPIIQRILHFNLRKSRLLQLMFPDLILAFLLFAFWNIWFSALNIPLWLRRETCHRSFPGVAFGKSAGAFGSIVLEVFCSGCAFAAIYDLSLVAGSHLLL